VKLVGQVRAEQSVKTPYYDVHKLCSKSVAEIPRMEELERRIRESGHQFVRTHFNDVGFRTDMEFKGLVALLK